MTLIQGRNGRTYDTATKQRVLTPVAHTEDRSREEIRRAEMKRYHRDPPAAPDPTINPIRRTIQEHAKLKGAVWAKSQTGREWLTEMEARADEWDQQLAEKQAASDFRDSIRDLTEFAQRDYESVLNDPHATVADTEDAAARLEIAKQGDRDTYKQLHGQYRDKVLQRIAERAATVENERSRLADTRDAILAESLEAPSMEVPQISEPQPAIDRSHVALTRQVRVGNSVRDEIEIVRADDPRLQ